jgi:hypothetical protein
MVCCCKAIYLSFHHLSKELRDGINGSIRFGSTPALPQVNPPTEAQAVLALVRKYYHSETQYEAMHQRALQGQTQRELQKIKLLPKNQQERAYLDWCAKEDKKRRTNAKTNTAEARKMYEKAPANRSKRNSLVNRYTAAYRHLLANRPNPNP